jgi:hypothetical protein
MILYTRGVEMEGIEDRQNEPPTEELPGTRTPQTPPASGGKAILVVLTVLVAAQLIATSFLYLAVMELDDDDGGRARSAPTGSFGSFELVSGSPAKLSFSSISDDVEPMDLLIRVESDSAITIYSCPENAVMVTLEPTPDESDLPTIEYWDKDSDGVVGVGDFLSISDLDDGTDYIVRLIWAPTGEIIDSVSFHTPGSEVLEPNIWFDDIEVISVSEARATFGRSTGVSPKPTSLRIDIWREDLHGSYLFSNDIDGSSLLLDYGDDIAEISYRDYADNGRVDTGDKLYLTGLDDGTYHILVLTWIPTNFMLDWDAFWSEAPLSVPTGVWGPKTPISSTAYNIDFGKVSGEPAPMNLEIILVRNLTDEGGYSFPSNDDGMLTFVSGTDIVDIEYNDLANNQKVNTGDYLKLTNLAPQSDYIIKLMWAPTGDQITTGSFSTS